MKLTKKFKLSCASLLAVCCVGTAAAGFALTGVTRASAAADEKWAISATPVSIGDEIVTVSANAFMINRSVDIMQLPNRTGVFYMYYAASVPWSGFTICNSTTATVYPWNLAGSDLTAFPWHTIGFENENNHMILQDNRVFSASTNGTHGGINGVDGENFKDGMVPVEIHIGEGKAAEDASYIKIGGVELLNESTNQPVTLAEGRADSGTSKELVASMFTEGAYLAINYNGSGDPLLAVTEPGSVVALNTSLNAKEAIQAGQFGKDLTMDLSSSEAIFGEGCTVTVKVNGKTENVTPALVAESDGKSAKLTLPEAELNKIPTNDFESVSYLTLSFEKDGKDYGDVAVALKILFEEPPVLEDSDLALDAVDAFTVSFTYSGEADPVNGTTITYQAAATDAAVALEATDFTVTKGENNKYTITFTKACAEKLFNGHSSTILQIKLGKHNLRVTAYVAASSSPYGVRYREGIDYVDGTLKQDKFYSSATMKKLNTSTKSSRIFYENSIDVTKPIYIEYATLDPSVEWGLISIMNTPAISEYFSNETSPNNGNTFCFILFGQGRHNMQGMNGSFKDGNTVEHANNTSMKNNFIEISFGAENPEDGYIKINGEIVVGAVFTKTQKDFPDGKAWVGWFFNNNQGEFNFTVNSHLNPVVINGPQDDSKYAMDLGKATDFTLDLLNTSGKLELTDESGAAIPATQYSYADGKLTIKAEYFSGKAYTKDGQIFIWDTEKETGTAFKMSYTNSDMGDVQIAYATKGAIEDVTFDLGATTVSGILSNEEAIPSEQYAVEDGKLILRKEAIKDEVGAQQFLVTADGTVYPCYVYVDTFKDGNALATGAAVTENGFTLAGNTARATKAQTYDISEGFKLGINFSTIDAYYERGVYDKATSVTLKFFDPLSGITFIVSIYANFPDDRVTSSTQALYISYGLYNAEGAKLAGSGERPVAPNDGNNSASGNHNFEIKENNGGISLTLAGRPYNISASAVGDYNMKAVIFTVTTENATAGSSAEVVLGGYGATEPGTNPGGDTPGTNPGDNPGTTPGGDKPGGEADNGCGSVIGGYGWLIALGTIALGAFAVIFAAKKREE